MKSSWTGDSGWKMSEDLIKFGHKDPVPAKGTWDSTRCQQRGGGDHHPGPSYELLLHLCFSHSISSFHPSCQPYEKMWERCPRCVMLYGKKTHPSNIWSQLPGEIHQLLFNQLAAKPRRKHDATKLVCDLNREPSSSKMRRKYGWKLLSLREVSSSSP